MTLLGKHGSTWHKNMLGTECRKEPQGGHNFCPDIYFYLYLAIESKINPKWSTLQMICLQILQIISVFPIHPQLLADFADIYW